MNIYLACVNDLDSFVRGLNIAEGRNVLVINVCTSKLNVFFRPYLHCIAEVINFLTLLCCVRVRVRV